ncbi:hypothetical protein protein, putative [Babesia ovis]|uniref:DUF1411 domain-containing protein n=1 Tax=Babesia ovis TaxID=5869 RepID=A0A9W5WV17_BABOV|nr:hypothetical protein protein, putative [Babesia ovis]
MVGENRQNSGLFKVAKWAMGIAAVGGAISGSVMSLDGSETIEPAQTEIPVKVDSAEVPVEPAQTEATADDIQKLDLTITLGESTFDPPFWKPKCNDPNKVKMPVLEKRLNQVIQHIRQHESQRDDLKPLKEVVQQHINQTANGIPVNVAVNLCQMNPGKPPYWVARLLPEYFAKKITDAELGTVNSCRTKAAWVAYYRKLIRYIDEAFATLTIN